MARSFPLWKILETPSPLEKIYHPVDVRQSFFGERARRVLFLSLGLGVPREV